MTPQELEALVSPADGLVACVVVAMPDCTPHAVYQRAEAHWDADPAATAAAFGALMGCGRDNLARLGAWTEQSEMTVESPDHVIVVRQLTPDFVVGFTFAGKTPLGLVRLHIARTSERIGNHLSATKPKPLSRGKKLLDYLDRYAPDTHAALLRLSLQTGLPMALLHQPDDFSDEEFGAVEDSVQRILGVERLSL